MLDFVIFSIKGVECVIIMKLLQSLRRAIYEEQSKIADTFAKQVGFKSRYDSVTVIEREHAKEAWKWLVQNKQLLLDSFPKENVKKLLMLDSIDADTDLSEVLVIFKQILRSQKARLISRKRYDWNVEQRRQSYTLEYRIISATPDPPPTHQTPVLSVCAHTHTLPSTPQTNKTTPSTTNTSHTNILDTKVSTTSLVIPTTVVMSAKRKLSPTPVLTHTSPHKKLKPSTPHIQQQPTPTNTVSPVSDVKVLDIHHTVSTTPTPTVLGADSPIALSPTPEGAREREQVPVQ